MSEGRMKPYEKLNELKSQLNKVIDRPTQVRILSEYLLNHMGANSIGKSKSSGEVFAEYESLLKENPDIPDVPKNTFFVSLSKISNEQGTKINCPGRKQGYYLEPLVQKLEQLEQLEETRKQEVFEKENEISDVIKPYQERDIYPVLKEWLFEKDFDRVADTSSLKSNGKWGNPDLVGLKIEDVYGRPEIEVTTIEVKLTDDDWEKWIFEAVAHTRFANRSYFAFLYPENIINKLDSTDIRLYAEHFGIGILVIGLNAQEYLNIKERKPANISADKLRIVEYHQAPYIQTHIKFRKKFLGALDILDLNKLYKFGEELN